MPWLSQNKADEQSVLPLHQLLSPTPRLPLSTLHSLRPVKMLPSTEILPPLSPNSELIRSSSVFLQHIADTSTYFLFCPASCFDDFLSCCGICTNDDQSAAFRKGRGRGTAIRRLYQLLFSARLGGCERDKLCQYCFFGGNFVGRTCNLCHHSQERQR